MPRKPASKKPKPQPAKPAPPPPRRHLSVEGVTESLIKFRGNFTAVAREFGVQRGSVCSYIDDHPELKTIVKDARESRVDMAESALDRAILDGESWAVMGTLKTLGKDRGYVEKSQVEHSGEVGAKGVVEIIVRTRAEADAVLALNKVTDVRSDLPETA